MLLFEIFSSKQLLQLHQILEYLLYLSSWPTIDICKCEASSQINIKSGSYGFH